MDRVIPVHVPMRLGVPTGHGAQEHADPYRYETPCDENHQYVGGLHMLDVHCKDGERTCQSYGRKEQLKNLESCEMLVIHVFFSVALCVSDVLKFAIFHADTQSISASIFGFLQRTFDSVYRVQSPLFFCAMSAKGF